MSKKKDLGIKIGTKQDVFWRNVKEKTEQEIESLENMLRFNRAILAMVEEKFIK